MTLENENINAPLAAFAGEKPPAPAWFGKALAHEPERSTVVSGQTRLEVLTWGEIGKPGLLFLHGSGANADWWSFIAPFFADRYRVTAFSWSGMGKSDWREAYSIDEFLQEVLDVSEATGLFATAEKPLVVAHSFGGRMGVFLSERHGERYKGIVILDPPIFAPDRQKANNPPRPPQTTKKALPVYPTLADALARFRFAPLQPCDNLYIADLIARSSLKEIEQDGQKVWTWRFDPNLWGSYKRDDVPTALKAAKTKLALIFGARSALMHPEDALYVKGLMPKGSPCFGIPDAEHHIMVDQPLALVSALEGLFCNWPEARS